MDRNSLLRVLVIAAALLLFWKFGLPLISGSNEKAQSIPQEVYTNAPGFVPDAVEGPVVPGQPNHPPEGELCTITGNGFDATLSSRGAAITHFRLEGGQYEGMDLSTTPDHERWRSLRTLFRGPEGGDQLPYDRFNWKLEPQAGAQSCTFSYEDEAVRIVKEVSALEAPFELRVATRVTNLSDAPKRHQYSIGEYAFRTNGQMKGSIGRPSPWLTELACASGGEVVRKEKGDFEAGWFNLPSADRYAAINSHYFSQALLPSVDTPEGKLPRCEILAEEWPVPGLPKDSDEAPWIFHAKLQYPGQELQPQATATYDTVAFFGPKERDVIATAGDGRLKDLINLGFFRPVARVLVGTLAFLHAKVAFGNWGIAIILMTVCLRLLLFPLTFKSIKSTIAMRRLKPEIDALNVKFKDDAQAKNLAMMELWKKHGVNPLGGCLPQLIQMPVWFAMYTTLQTAVEMYHVKFLWFPDLSAPDPYYVLPLVLGGLMIIQQRLIPQQGMDPMQQKMMMWMLPIMFTVMMLFLPAALGVYMLTNSILGIGQQLVLERVAPSSKGGGKDIVVKQKGETSKGPGGDKSLGNDFGKGKARV